MKKILCSLLVSLSLGATVFIGNNNNVNAAPNAESHYWFKQHTVTVKHTVTAYKVHIATISANDSFIGKKVLKPGTRVTVQNGGASWHWLISGTGMSSNSDHFWILKDSSSNWIK